MIYSYAHLYCQWTKPLMLFPVQGHLTSLFHFHRIRKIFLLVIITSIFFSDIPEAFAQNRQRIDSLELALFNCKNDTCRIICLYEIGYELEEFEFIEAEKYYQEALTLSETMNLKTKTSVIYNGLGKVNLNKGSYEQAIDYLENSLRINKELNDSVLIAGNYDNLCIANMRLGNYDTAIVLRKKAMDIYLLRNNKPRIADAFLWIGNCELVRGFYFLALKNYLNSLEIAEEIKYTEGIAYASVSCASVYRHQKDYVKALELDSLGLIAFKKLDKRREVATVYYNIGIIYEEQDNNKSALENLLTSLYKRSELRDSSGMGDCYNAIGRVYINMDRFTDAEKFLVQALKIAEQTGEKRVKVVALVNLGDLESNKGNFDTANSYLLKGLNMAEEIEDREGKKFCYSNLSMNYEKLNDTKNALKYFKLYKEADDLIKEEIMSRDILELQALYDTEKQKETITQLKIEEAKQALQLAESKQIENQKNRLFAATTAVLMIFIFLFWREQINKKRTNEILYDLRHATTNTLPEHVDKLEKVRETAVDRQSQKILSHLAYQTRATIGLYDILYGGYKSNRTIDLEVFIRELADKHKTRWPIKKEVHMSIDIKPKTVFLKDARIHGLILNEFMTNSFKYAFPDDKLPKFTIKLFREGKKTTFYLKDNGVGYPEPIEHLMSSDLQGLTLIKLHARRLKGEVKFYNHEDGGAVCEITGIRYRKVAPW